MKISIIIPVFNVSDYILECINSVIVQKGDIECIIVNDCTQDNSMLILKDYLNDYVGNIDFKIVEHSINRGLSIARNTGLDMATGDYIFFLDSDDKLPEMAIEKMTACLLNIDFPCCVIGDYDSFEVSLKNLPKSNCYLDLLPDNKSVLHSFLNCQWYPMAWNKLVSRKFLLDNSLYFREGMLHEDELWSYQLALKLPSLKFCHELTYLYRVRSNSITGSKRAKNFKDNLIYCEYMLDHNAAEFEKETNIFLQNRLNVILLEMHNNHCSIDEIWNMCVHIKINFGVRYVYIFNSRSMLNNIRNILLYYSKNILSIYLHLRSVNFLR